MQCRICGSEANVDYRTRSRMTLCDDCHKTTPAKVTRETFDREYWGADFETVPQSTRREFYEDYKASTVESVRTYAAFTSSCNDRIAYTD